MQSLTRIVFPGLLLTPCLAWGQLRIATYNTETAFNSGGTPNPGLQNVLGGMGNEAVGGLTKRVDILCLQEQNNTTGTTTSQILTMMNSLYGAGIYNKGTVVSGATSNPNTDSSAVIWDTTRVTLISEVAIGITSTSGMPRQEIRYQFRPVGYGSNSDFYLFVGHWKAGGTADDQDRRNVEAQFLRSHVNTVLPAGSRVVYVGDMNLTQGTSEASWTTMTAAGNGQAIDPFSGNFGNVARTWSTTGLGSRLDFQLNTPPTTDGEGFSLINGTYHTFGNNGTTPSGGSATHGNNTALPGLPNRSTVLSSLTTASDHYPVVADYRIPAKMGVFVGSVPSQVIVGATAPVNVTVTNAAPVIISGGADGLDYSVSGSGQLSGAGAGTNLMALTPGNFHALNFNTTTPGVKNGTVNASSTSQEVADGSFSQNVSTTVLAHSNASFDAGSNVDLLPIDFGIRARGSGLVNSGFSISNLADATGFTAGLDLDSVTPSGNSAQLNSNVTTFSNLAPGNSLPFSATLDTANLGSYSTNYVLSVSDQDLPGATAGSSLVLMLTGRVAIGGDATLDDVVNLNDFNTLAANFGSTSGTWQTGDFTLDQIVNLNDFNVLAGNFGMTASAGGPTPEDWSRLATLVPEPAFSAAALAIGGMLLRRRR